MKRYIYNSAAITFVLMNLTGVIGMLIMASKPSQTEIIFDLGLNIFTITNIGDRYLLDLGPGFIVYPLIIGFFAFATMALVPRHKDALK